MTIERKVGMGIAGQPSGGAANVADVFSTDLYDGKDSSQTINNGIDLAGEGGMVWQKLRAQNGSSDGQDHYLRDTVRGGGRRVYSNKTNGQNEDGGGISSFNSNGFSIGNVSAGNLNGAKYVTWTFRKKKKFFDIVTYSGSGSAKTVAHNLESVPAMMLIKSTNASSNWRVYHSGMGATKSMKLNSAEAPSTNTAWFNDTAPTDSVFTVGVGSDMNASGRTYLVYLFADNSSEDAEDQMIKCGSYTEASGGVSVNLGWEPQWLLIKTSSEAGNWWIIDKQRGWTADGAVDLLAPNTDGAEIGPAGGNWKLTSTGFESPPSSSTPTYIWMAIRGPMMVEPEAATDVFAMYSGGTSQSYPQYLSGFPVDMALHRATTSTNSELATRLLGAGLLKTNATDAWGASGAYAFDYSNGWFTHGSPTYFTNYKSWMWKRAKGFMDCVAYSGSGVAKTEAHSLGVAPEMIWVKSRANAQHWAVYHPSSHAAGNTLFISTSNGGAGVDGFQSTAVSDTTFNVTTADYTNESGWTYVAYLFATLAGISKVGSYTGNGSNQTINCGFSAGSRFVLIKRIGADGNWYVWDSVRGIVAGNDPHLSLNTSAAQVTSDDSIDPANAGFIVNQVSATNINVSSGTYIFYAIA